MDPAENLDPILTADERRYLDHITDKNRPLLRNSRVALAGGLGLALVACVSGPVIGPPLLLAGLLTMAGGGVARHMAHHELTNAGYHPGIHHKGQYSKAWVDHTFKQKAKLFNEASVKKDAAPAADDKPAAKPQYKDNFVP